MGVRHRNSTGYVHPDEPNLLNIHKALEYNAAGQPALRTVTNIEGDIIVTGDVTIPGSVEISNDAGNPVPVNGTVSVTQPVAVTDNGSTLSIDDGGGSITVDGNITATIEGVSKTSTNRLKTSNKVVVFSNTFQFSKEVDLWDEQLLNGATSVNDQFQSSVIMTVTSSPGSRVVRQTRKVMHYVPGRSAEFTIVATNVNLKVGHRARIGVFDERNGVFFERAADGELYAVVRSSVSGSAVDTRVSQSNFNLDRMDGTGPSGIVDQPGTIRTLHIEYEWYGAGDVIFSYIIGGKICPLHRFTFANIITTSWCSTPFNPIRLELENISSNSSAVLEQYSTSYSLEGEIRSIGIPKITGIPIPGVQIPGILTYRPVLSLRLKPNSLNAVVFLEEVQAFTSSNSFLTFRIVRNATLNAVTWTDHQTGESAVEVNVDATTATGGVTVALGVIPLNGIPYVLDTGHGEFQLGRYNLGTTSDVFSLLLACATNNATALGTLRWREVR